jgi:hypothetical protein
MSCLLICIRSIDSPYLPICLLDMFDLELQKLHYQSRYLSRRIPPSTHCQLQLAKPWFALINAHHWSSSGYSYPVLWYNRHTPAPVNQHPPPPTTVPIAIHCRAIPPSFPPWIGNSVHINSAQHCPSRRSSPSTAAPILTSFPPWISISVHINQHPSSSIMALIAVHCSSRLLSLSSHLQSPITTFGIQAPLSKYV